MGNFKADSALSRPDIALHKTQAMAKNEKDSQNFNDKIKLC